MRITQSISYRNFLETSESLNARLAAASLQVSSGKRLGSLQDAPGDSAELVSLRAGLDRLEQYGASADRSRYFLSVADATLDSVQNLYTSIFTKASLAATGSSDAAARAALATEVRGLRDEILALANTRVEGRYLFAGSAVADPAFTIAGDTATYQGNGAVNTVTIAGGMAVRVNVPGDAALSAVFDNIEAMLQAMDAGDAAAIQAALDPFSTAKDALSSQRALLGASLAELDDVAAHREGRQTSLETRQSALEDADLAVAASDLARIETALRAAMSAGARLDGPSLFDYLG